MIITSNKPLNEMANMTHPINQYVSELTKAQSVALFFETLDKIGFKGTKEKDIYEMILKDEKYPI